MTASLDELIGKQIRVQGDYKDTPEGPFICMGFDRGFIKLYLPNAPEDVADTFWWSLKDINGIRLFSEYTDREGGDVNPD